MSIYKVIVLDSSFAVILKEKEGKSIVEESIHNPSAMGDQLLGSSSSCTAAIGSSNIGFQLLKKHGWKEGSGLGISEQGRLEPVQAFFRNNKRGLGAEKLKRLKPKSAESPASREQNGKEQSSSKKSKALSKKMRKMQELEKQLQDKEFERAFLREFWPDNV